MLNLALNITNQTAAKHLESYQSDTTVKNLTYIWNTLRHIIGHFQGELKSIPQSTKNEDNGQFSFVGLSSVFTDWTTLRLFNLKL